MTIAELFENKGKTEGKAEVMRVVVLRCLQHNLSLDVITGITRLSISEIKLLQATETF